MRLLARAVTLLLIALPVSAQPADGHGRIGVLREMNNAVETLARFAISWIFILVWRCSEPKAAPSMGRDVVA